MGRLQIFTNQRDATINPSDFLFDISGDQGNTYKYQTVTLNAGDYPDPVVCCCFFRFFLGGGGVGGISHNTLLFDSPVRPQVSKKLM